MIDLTCIATARILWCTTHKHMLLVTENRSKTLDGLVYDGTTCNGWCVGDNHKGPLIMGKTPLSKNNENRQTHPQTTKHTSRGHGSERRWAHDPKSRSGPPNGRPRYPSGVPPPRSRARRHATGLHLARGLDAPSGESPPRSRAGRPLGRVSASLEGLGPPSESLPRSRPP
jgi:hypothetical protein